MTEKLKNKKVYIILIILMVVAVLSVGTYALLLWSSEENTEMTLRIGDFAEVIFPPLNEDTDPSDGITISGNQVTVSNMGPVFDYEKDGATLEFSIISLASDTIISNASLHITTISDNLKADDFKVVVLHSKDNTNYTKLFETDFTSASNESDIQLYNELKILDKAYFKVIFYIDGNMLNDSSIQGGSLSAYITINAEKPNKLINPNCTNATAIFDYTKKSILLSNTSATGAITCSPSQTFTRRTYFSDYITSLLGSNSSVLAESTTGNGSTLEVVNSPLPDGTNTSTDYRYRGVNPANYVMFNDELWRIIGVFDSNSHNFPNTNLVKIIRNDSIGAYVWEGGNYVNSYAYKILNDAYYNTTSIDAEPIDATGENYCYKNKTYAQTQCDFTKIGIQPEYKKMVEAGVTWYLGGNGSDAITASDFYKYERTSTKVYSGNAPSGVAPIGLMYASDYGYAAPSACNDTNVGSFDSSNSTLGTSCAAKNWLKSNWYEWTITHNSSNSSSVFYVYYTGGFNYARGSSYGYEIRPVIYLTSAVYYLSGTGKQTDPYIIAMD